MRAAVVGGGVAGLVAAHRLIANGLDVTVFEAASRLGGQIHTVRANGFVVEQGADGFLVHDTGVAALLDELSLRDRLAHQRSTATEALEDGRLRSLEPGQAAAALGLAVDKSLTGHGTVTFPGGLGELVEQLATRIETQGIIQRRRPVDRVAAHHGAWTLHTTNGAFTADALVIATPPKALATLLEPLSEPGARPFHAIRALSSITVALAYRESDVRSPQSSTGFIIPDQPRAREGLKACTFASSKFAGRAPAGAVLLRAYYRAGPSFPIGDADRDWIQRAATDLTPVLEIVGHEQFGWVSRWPDALYQLPRDHAQRVRRVARELQAHAPIEVAGAACDGVGVSTAIASGLAAADRLLQRV